MTLERIKFEPSDFPQPHLEPTAQRIASFLYESSSMIIDRFLDLMARITKLENHKNFLQRWFAQIIKSPKKAPQDLLDLQKYCYEFFNVCKNEEDVRKMRGLVPEKLFEIVFKKRHIGKVCNIDYGVKVIIDDEPVLYRPKKNQVFECKSNQDKNGPRQTVDGGFWDGEIGEFVEIKLQPHTFKTEDVNYLNTLVDEMLIKKMSYQIYLVAFGNRELIEVRLKRLGLLQKTSKGNFTLVGIDEFFDLENKYITA